MKRVVAVNESGYRIGQDHWRASLTDEEVDRLLALRESDPATWSYRKLAEVFEVSKSAVRWYCKGGRRCQTAARHKTVHVSGD